jgi:hypothetical protein
VPVPAAPGAYRVALWAERGSAEATGDLKEKCPPARMRLIVRAGADADGGACCPPLLETVQAALVEADRLRRLPTDYADVTEGAFAAWKRRVKRKLLNNFKVAYVDVLSRQQSAFNDQVLAALGELAECCATLDHAVRGLQERLARLEERARPPESLKEVHS